MSHSGKGNIIWREIISRFAKVGYGEERFTTKAHEGTFWSDRNILNLNYGGNDYENLSNHIEMYIPIKG